MAQERKDSKEWFVEEVLCHESELRRWLRNRFSLISDIENLIQEAYTRLIKAYESGPIANPRAFLFVTTRNLAFNEIRHFKHELKVTADDLHPLVDWDDVAVNPFHRAALCEEVSLLKEAIRKLPKRCRQIITLRKLYGLSQREIANRLGISINTVENQGTIGLKKCAEYFSQKGYKTRFTK